MNTIEWALKTAREGERVTRKGWELGVWLEWGGAYFYLCKGEHSAPYTAGGEDLRATDWELAK